jgi:hypothetical protein
MDTISKFFLPGIIFLLTLASGVWLSSSGKPLNAILFNIHKLIALAAVVLLVIQLVNTFKSTHPQSLLIAMIVLAGVCVLALFISGAMMSIGIPAYALMLTIHRVAMALMTVSLAGTIYLLFGRMV